MIRFGLTSDQLASTRFVVSPLTQLVTALVRVRSMPQRGRVVHAAGLQPGRQPERPGRQPGRQPVLERLPDWLREGWAAVPSEHRLVLERLVDPSTHYVPDFLSPVPCRERPTVQQQLDDVRATPLEAVRAELRRCVQVGDPADEGASASVRRAPTDPELRAWNGDPAPLLDEAAAALEAAWQAIMAPMWPTVRDVLEADILHRSRLMAQTGVAEAVLDLMHGRRAPDGALLVESVHDYDLSCHSGPVLLAPDVMVDGPGHVGIIFGAGGELLLAYPSRGRALLSAGKADHDLAVVVGGTRQRLLAALGEPSSGQHLATVLAVTAPTVSYHLARLHRAGLVHRRRVGKQVLWSRSVSGDHLLGEPLAVQSG